MSSKNGFALIGKGSATLDKRPGATDDEHLNRLKDVRKELLAASRKHHPDKQEPGKPAEPIKQQDLNAALAEQQNPINHRKN